MDMDLDLTEFAAVFLALTGPIVTVLAICWVIIVRVKQNAKLKNNIINSRIDPELAKTLLPPKDSKNTRMNVLRWACALLGLGVGALICSLFRNINDYQLPFYIILAAGIGFGLLVSFIVEWHLEKHEERGNADESGGNADESGGNQTGERYSPPAEEKYSELPNDAFEERKGDN